jgi:biotin synthase-like enzyme
MENALQAHEQITNQIEAILPKEKVIQQAKSFLEGCGWKLEINSTMVSIPEDTELSIRSRAYIKADAEDVFLGDHYEAVVLLGIESIEEYKQAKYGVLRMYFNLEGRFVSEDRYNRYA